MERDNRDAVKFGLEVRRRRKELNLTLEQLAERAGLTPHYIGAIENGYRDPSLSTVDKLARALGVPKGVLLGRAPVLSPIALVFAKLFDAASRETRAGLLMILRLMAKLRRKPPRKD